MKKKLTLVVAVVLVHIVALAQLGLGDVSSIPEAVKKNASVIKRYEEMKFEVTDIDRASLQVRQVMTIMNDNGRRALVFQQYTNKFDELEEADIKLFDASGKLISRYKKKELNVAASGEGLVDEGKVYYMRLAAPAYPVTVEYNYTERFRGTLFYPTWDFISAGEGVEYSSMIAKVPKEFDLRYKCMNTKITPEITDDGKYKTYRWEVKNLAPIEYEEGAVSSKYRYPSVILAPNVFKMDDYNGDMTSWNKFGNWYGSLKKGIDVLPEDRKDFFRDMVKNAKDDKEKARLIYDYLQKNFRYVAISLGIIGGYRPLPAVFTDQKKYGDCKGLSNYMQAAMDAIGVKSYQALINREVDGPPVDPSFPCNQFNHAILVLPFKNDTTWLECTSRTLDFGILDMSTENKLALVITEQGGILVATPKSQADENTMAATSTIDIDESGGGKTNTVLNTSGEYREELINFLFDQKEDDQKNYIVHRLGFKQPDVFSVKRTPDNGNKSTTINMEIEKIPEFSAGSKMFVNPRLCKLWTLRLPKSENRKQDFYFGCPFVKTDTTVFKLPAGYATEALPQAKDLKCEYGSYSTKYWYDEAGRALYSTTKLVLKDHRIPAAKYPEVKKFFDDVLADDAQRIVLKKN